MIILKWYVFIVNTLLALFFLKGYEDNRSTIGTFIFFLISYYIPLVVYLILSRW